MVISHWLLVDFDTTVLLCVNTFYYHTINVTIRYTLTEAMFLGSKLERGGQESSHRQMHFSRLLMNIKYKILITESTYEWNGFRETALKVPSL